MTSVEDLIAAIEANPHDREACVVYADYLLEQGDPLGEVMAAELGKRAGERPFYALSIAYLRDHFATILEDLEWHSTWKNGLVERLEISTHLGVEAVKAIAHTPAARFMRELKFFVGPRDRSSEDVFVDPIPALLEYPLPPTLRKLHFMTLLPQLDGSYLRTNLEPLYPQLANLHDLTIIVSADELGTIDLPALRRLELGFADEGVLQRLSHAKLPRLRTLHFDQISIWPSNLDLEAPELERLIVGGTSNMPHGRGYAEMVETPLVKRIRALEMRKVWNEGVAALIAIAPRLVHLSEIRVHARRLEGAARAELMRILGPRLVLE